VLAEISIYARQFLGQPIGLSLADHLRGVMGVINMAHGEFIMIGAYTGYVVQQFIPNYTVSIIVALPLAFTVPSWRVWRWNGW
jgi:branched-subunit amino acid ABC-type transport system permease component